MNAKRWFVLGLALTLVGCASAPAGENGERTARANRNLITTEEIQANARHTTTFELVQALRPNWMRGRHSGTVNNANTAAVVVYVDGARVGGIEHLRQIPRIDVVTLQYLDASDATTRFGTGHMGGAILVTTQRRGG